MTLQSTEASSVVTPAETKPPEPPPAAAETASAPAAPSAPTPTGTYKIVISVKDDEAIIGVKSEDTDPVFFVVKGDMHTILAEVEADVKEAKTRWQTSKLMPKTTAPTPSQTTTPVPAPARQSSTPAKPPAPKLQPSFDL
jgi:hypothetical protein